MREIETDPGYLASTAALERLEFLFETLQREEDGETVDWADTPAIAPFDGCPVCIVREVLAAGVQVLAEHGVDLTKIAIGASEDGH
jgi:hypothetical protein